MGRLNRRTSTGVTNRADYLSQIPHSVLDNVGSHYLSASRDQALVQSLSSLVRDDLNATTQLQRSNAATLGSTSTADRLRPLLKTYYTHNLIQSTQTQARRRFFQLDELSQIADWSLEAPGGGALPGNNRFDNPLLKENRFDETTLDKKRPADLLPKPPVEVSSTYSITNTTTRRRAFVEDLEDPGESLPTISGAAFKAPAPMTMAGAPLTMAGRASWSAGDTGWPRAQIRPPTRYDHKPNQDTFSSLFTARPTGSLFVTPWAYTYNPRSYRESHPNGPEMSGRGLPKKPASA